MTTTPHDAAAADRPRARTDNGVARLAEAPDPADSPASVIAHLTPERWERATRLLIRKALAEFSHERLLTPEPLPAPETETGTGTEAATATATGTGTEAAPEPATGAPGRYRVTTDEGATSYRFTARRHTLDHWQVDPDSITRHSADGTELPLDALAFFVELRHTLGLSDAVLPVYLEEISSTLAGTAYKLAAPHVPAAQLAAAGFQAVETGMTEGHPCFVANNGRLGFDSAEYHAYAPEAARPLQLLWLAARRDRATFTASADLDYDTLIHGELDEPTLSRFAATLAGVGLTLDDVRLIPVHPWQWWNKLSVTFAAELAQRRLVCLGYGDDTYLAQQSVRTFFNTSQPTRHYVKTALSVLNMGFMRGLSAAYMEVTPAINDWLAGLIAGDEVLTGTGFSILRERAAVGYRHETYEAAAPKGSPYLKMLAALWRESPVTTLAPGERLATMASLLHTDRDGNSFAAALIASSGLSAREWLRGYLHAYLTPVLHCFYAHDLVFMPHGENVILVLDEDGAVRRSIFKDIAEEIAVFSPDAPLPPEAERVRVEMTDDIALLSVFTDVFDCFLRFLGPLLATDGTLAEDDFWAEVAACVRAYQASAPHLAARFERFDMFTEHFALSCLNRLQLRDNRQMVDLADPAGALQLVGTLANPLAGH